MTVSQLVLLGNLVADPELSELSDDRRLTRLRVAAHSRLQDPSTGRWKDGETTFLTVVAWRALADSARTLRKGERILVIGQLRQYDYARHGMRNTGYEVTAEHIARPLDTAPVPARALPTCSGNDSQPSSAGLPHVASRAAAPVAVRDSASHRGDTGGDGVG